MDWTWYILLLIVLLIGWFINIVGLPGLWLMIAATAVYAWATGWIFMGLWTLAILLVIGLLAEVVEFIAGAAGARKVGGSRRSAWGAIIGGIAGALLLAIPIPVVGAIVGACLGAFIGALAAELTVAGDINRSFQVGTGAAKGRFLGIMSKLAFGFVIFVIVVWRAMPIAW